MKSCGYTKVNNLGNRNQIRNHHEVKTFTERLESNDEEDVVNACLLEFHD